MENVVNTRSLAVEVMCVQVTISISAGVGVLPLFVIITFPTVCDTTRLTKKFDLIARPKSFSL